MFILLALACTLTNAPAAINTPTAQAVKSRPIFSPSPPATQLTATACTITAESLNVRSSPGTTSVLAWIYKGEIVTILETSGEWFYIQAENVTGWINKNYCEVNQ